MKRGTSRMHIVTSGEVNILVWRIADKNLPFNYNHIRFDNDIGSIILNVDLRNHWVFITHIHDTAKLWTAIVKLKVFNFELKLPETVAVKLPFQEQTKTSCSDGAYIHPIQHSLSQKSASFSSDARMSFPRRGKGRNRETAARLNNSGKTSFPPSLIHLRACGWRVQVSNNRGSGGSSQACA